MSESSFNLSQAIFDRIEDLGVAAAAKFFGRTESVIKKWSGGTVAADVAAAQKVLDEAMDKGLKMPVFGAPPPQGETVPEPAATLEGVKPKPTTAQAVDPVKKMKEARKFNILIPVNREMSYASVVSLLAQWKATLPLEIRDMLSHLDFEPDTSAMIARNRLATRFIEDGQDEWSFWMDSDMIAPTGNPSWFKRRTGMKHADTWLAKAAIERLTARGKSFVGAVYAQRSTDRKIVASPSSAKNEGDKIIAEEIKNKGPQDKIIEVEWLGFGCVAIHRQVFLDILARVPGVKAEVKGQPHQFFNPLRGGNEGEDMAFCARARQAGHPAYLDLAVHCAHIGKFAFLP